jgi:hypothetical protein
MFGAQKEGEGQNSPPPPLCMCVLVLFQGRAWVCRCREKPGCGHQRPKNKEGERANKGLARRRSLTRGAGAGAVAVWRWRWRWHAVAAAQCPFHTHTQGGGGDFAPRLQPGAAFLFFQLRRPDFSVFELFSAAWCVRTPQPRGTQPRLRCSVVGLLRAPPAPRLRFCRGSASCAFPALSPTRFGLLVATKPHTSGGLAALRVPGGEGDSRDISGV